MIIQSWEELESLVGTDEYLFAVCLRDTVFQILELGKITDIESTPSRTALYFGGAKGYIYHQIEDPPSFTYRRGNFYQPKEGNSIGKEILYCTRKEEVEACRAILKF